MTIEIRDGELSSLIRKNSSKLVAVDFSSVTCGPCRAIRPFWESLPQKYPTVVFASVECGSCPTECQTYQIQATPTFIFILKGSVVHRIMGGKRDEILSTLDKYKTSDYAGKARTLGDIPQNNNYFEQLLSGGKPQPVQPIKQPVQTPKPQPRPQPAYDPQIRETLQEMEFSEDLIEAALRHGGSIEDCLEYIEKIQTGQISLDDSSNTPPANDNNDANPPNNNNNNDANDNTNNTNAPHAADAESAAILEEDLGPEGEAMKARLVEMGYDPTLAAASIQVMGHDSIEKCIDGIQRMLRGQNLAPPMTEEEKKAKLEELQRKVAEKKAAKVDPTVTAKNELNRRKQMQEDIAARKKFEQMQRENELKLARKEKEQAKLERERVLAKIRAQRNQNSGSNNQTSNTQQTPNNQASNAQQNVAQQPQKKAVTECQLRLVFPDNSAQVLKFNPHETMYDVETTLRSVKSGLPRKIGFEIPYPRSMISQDSFSLTLEALQLCPRSQLNVKFL